MLLANLKTLLKHSWIYSLGWAASSLAGIVLMPLYTRYMGTEDYGIIEVISHANTVLTLILASGLNYAIAKFYNLEQHPQSKSTIISTGILAAMVSSIGGTLLLFFQSRQLSSLILGTAEQVDFVHLGLGILALNSIFQILLVNFTVKKQSATFLCLSLLALVVGIGANIFFIVYKGMGARGMLWGKLLGQIPSVLVASILCFRQSGMRLSLPKLRAMVLFGLPMIPVSLCGAVMHNADRFLIRYFCSLSDVGLYSLGYLFPMSLNALVLGSFNSIWGGATLYEISKAEDAPFQYGRIATYFMSFFVTCMFALALFSKSIVRIFAAPAFFEAHQIIPIVCFGFCLHAFYSFTTMGAFIKGKTSILIPAYIIPAILNIVANMVLLPRFGYGAAAWTTVLTYGVFAFLSWFVCRKMIQIHFETTRLVKLFSAALSVFVLYRLCDRFESVFATIVIQITLAVLFPAILYLSGFLTPQEHRVIKQKGLTLLKHLRMAHS